MPMTLSCCRRLLLLFCVSAMCLACKATQPLTYPETMMRDLVKAGNALGFDIEEDDHHELMLACAKWLGTPHSRKGRAGGIDCSGFTTAIYAEVFDTKLSPSSTGQYRNDVERVDRDELKQGDLVFFGSRKKSANCNHVGIYLKDGLFIHTSSSKGVTVTRLDEPYWKRRLKGFGRVKK